MKIIEASFDESNVYSYIRIYLYPYCAYAFSPRKHSFWFNYCPCGFINIYFAVIKGK